MSEIKEETTKINPSIGEGDYTVSEITFDTEEGRTIRFFDRNKSKERSFSDTIVFEKVEVIYLDE